mmetsp:Transcript_3475/g.12834  ORF Transcript_3475/g.12834 Transcript_3475/m.12834 type:complete len:222 (-) Transcript_3475:980-1645(-)
MYHRRFSPAATQAYLILWLRLFHMYFAPTSRHCATFPNAPGCRSPEPVSSISISTVSEGVAMLGRFTALAETATGGSADGEGGTNPGGGTGAVADAGVTGTAPGAFALTLLVGLAFFASGLASVFKHRPESSSSPSAFRARMKYVALNAPPSLRRWYATSRSLYPKAMPTSTLSYCVTAGLLPCAPSLAIVFAARAGLIFFGSMNCLSVLYKTQETPAWPS